MPALALSVGSWGVSKGWVLTMPTLTISSPADGAPVPSGQPVAVTGEATDRGGAEPVMIDSVSVQVDDGAPVPAVLHHVHDPHLTVVTFSATVPVDGAEGPHTITVVATNDAGLSTTKSRTVYLGPSLAIGAPVIRLEFETIAPIDPAGDGVQKLVKDVQKALVSTSSLLAAVHKTVAGPAIVVETPPTGLPVTRIGVWVVDAGSVALLPPDRPDYPLPRLADATAAAGFAQVPVLSRPRRSGLFDMPYGVAVDTAAMQDLVNAALIRLGDDRIRSVTVSVSPPDTVTTTLHGEDYDVPFSATVTEKLAVAPLAGSNPPVSGPVVTHTVSTSLGSVLDWVLGTLTVLVDVALLIGWQEASRIADAETQKGSVASLLAAELPTNVPFHNDAVADLPEPLRFDFPTLVADWSTFGAAAEGIVGSGDATVQGRSQDMVRVELDGPDFVHVPPGEVIATQVFTVVLHNLAPDGGAVTVSVRSALDDTDKTQALAVDPITQHMGVAVDFPMPLHASPGDYHYAVSVSATETCASDATKVLTGSASKNITVRKPASTGHLPEQPGHHSPVAP